MRAQALDDDDFYKFNASLHRYYHQDPIYNPIAVHSSGPTRPPIRKILALYGVNVHTDIGYTYRVGSSCAARGGASAAVAPTLTAGHTPSLLRRRGWRALWSSGHVHKKLGLKLEDELFEGPGGKLFSKSTRLLSTFKPVDSPTVRLTARRLDNGDMPFAAAYAPQRDSRCTAPPTADATSCTTSPATAWCPTRPCRGSTRGTRTTST